jgi:hypothetical protein
VSERYIVFCSGILGTGSVADGLPKHPIFFTKVIVCRV